MSHPDSIVPCRNMIPVSNSILLIYRLSSPLFTSLKIIDQVFFIHDITLLEMIQDYNFHSLSIPDHCETSSLYPERDQHPMTIAGLKRTLGITYLIGRLK